MREGDLVEADQVVAQIDVAELKAQRAKYVADMAMQEASLLEPRPRSSSDARELNLKEANLQRAAQLVRTEAVSQRTLDEARSWARRRPGDLAATEKNVDARQSSIQAAQALIDQTDAQIADATLRSPVRGRYSPLGQPR